ncbi:MAG: hypothetical protein JNL61_19920 [Rhizobiaceae bacterium]|nr:hypothetical protein [Rhizobiaceae bacterium]
MTPTSCAARLKFNRFAAASNRRKERVPGTCNGIFKKTYQMPLKLLIFQSFINGLLQACPSFPKAIAMTDIDTSWRADARSRALSLERLRIYLVSRQQRREAIDDIHRLNERAQRDAGVAGTDVAKQVDAEMTRLGLRELGSRGLR